MPIYEYEMMHGAVLTKLCRNDQPTSLSLIETCDKHWSVYWINATVVLYIKHATNPREDKRGKLRWQFTFTSDLSLCPARSARANGNLFVGTARGRNLS